ncbi:MAG: hypothetical protein O7G32_06240 [SAR324 cluster bacterium]|nr:hypothetical protein [SAR324 cluster bacterium]
MDYRRFENITFWPIFHYRMEFAAVVRSALLADPPDVVAVEFPATWREPILRGVNRLPFLSLVLGEAGADHLYLPIEPTDAGVEALRTAKELGVPSELIDLDVDRYPFHTDPLPDSYALPRLGYDALLQAYYAEGVPRRDALDEQRETMMAHALQQLAADSGRVACVIGAAHLPGLLEKLRSPQPRPLARAKPRNLKLYNWSEKSSREFLSEAPFLAAAYEHWRGKIRQPGAMVEDAREEAAPTAEAAAVPTVESAVPDMPDREQEAGQVLREAVLAYEARYLDEIPANRLRSLANFTKKYALIDGLLTPDLYHLVVGARGVVDDDFAYELWDLGSTYPWQDGSGLLPTIDIDESFAILRGRRLTLRRKLRRNRPRLSRFSEKKRLREQHGKEWKARWSGQMICSHQPEDLLIEDYGRYLKHKARGMLSAEHTRVEPFQVSLKDGIDVRETLRNWHEQKLYVRDIAPLAGEMGSVVVIFDEDRPEGNRGEAPLALAQENYPWLVTWLGEHEQESDMAFYATPAGEEVVGPGISRCEYGGFLLSYPPRRMVDVWRDPFFDMVRNKPERLLLAGLDYSVQRHVLYIAGRPPRSWFNSIAERMGKKLVYLPIGQLNPATLKSIRSFHVLDGHHVREYAKDYVR